MYLFKFIKWFFTQHFDNAADRVIAIFVIWLSVFIPITIVSIIFDMPIIFGYCLLASVSALFLTGVGIGIGYLRKVYLKWQSQVFDRLRE